MPLWFLLILVCLTTSWVTYLAVASKLFKAPRDKMISWLDPRDEMNVKIGRAPLGWFGRSVGFLMGCEWCTSAYVAAAVIYATAGYVSVPLPVLWWGPACMFTGTMASVLGWGEQRWRLNRAQTWQAEDDFRKRGFRIPQED